MRQRPRDKRLAATDLRAPWQIEQAARCGCRGTDEMCPCQNERPWPRPAPPEPEDAQPYKDALHDLVMLHAQQDIGCVPPPTRAQWAAAWAVAEELTRVEP